MNSFEEVFGKVSPPPELGDLAKGPEGITLFINNAIALFYSIAAFAVIVMLLWGAWEWITAGSDKGKIDSARTMITRAIMGLIFLSFIFVILYVLGKITHFEFTTPSREVIPGAGYTQNQ